MKTQIQNKLAAREEKHRNKSKKTTNLLRAAAGDAKKGCGFFIFLFGYPAQETACGLCWFFYRWGFEKGVIKCVTFDSARFASELMVVGLFTSGGAPKTLMRLFAAFPPERRAPL